MDRKIFTILCCNLFLSRPTVYVSVDIIGQIYSYKRAITHLNPGTCDVVLTCGQRFHLKIFLALVAIFFKVLYIL